MKHGYKRAIAMLLAATVMTGLTACGGGSSSGGGSGSASGGSGDGTFTASGKTLNAVYSPTSFLFPQFMQRRRVISMIWVWMLT